MATATAAPVDASSSVPSETDTPASVTAVTAASQADDPAAAAAVVVVKTSQSSKLTSPSSSSSSTLSEYADRVIFMGDMNYRVRGTRNAVDKLLKHDMHDVMIHNDQLIWSMRHDLVPAEYVEPPLHFKPTYKFDLNSDIYDTGSKARIPAWCDRVLYIKRGLQCVAYDADTSLKTSDHRPVFATFMVDIAFEEGDGAVEIGDGEGSPHDEGHPEFSSESQVCTIM